MQSIGKLAGLSIVLYIKDSDILVMCYAMLLGNFFLN